MDESDGRSYIINHIQNQLSFDLWYIFLGCFCICIAEANKIADTTIPVGDSHWIFQIANKTNYFRPSRCFRFYSKSFQLSEL